MEWMVYCALLLTPPNDNIPCADFGPEIIHTAKPKPPTKSLSDFDSEPRLGPVPLGPLPFTPDY